MTRSSDRGSKPELRFASGHTIDERFVVQSLLGEGATGAVYAAKDKTTNEPVALKVIHRHLVSDRQIRSRFYREAELLRRLCGEHLVALRAFGEHDGLLYMALDLASGTSLEALMLHQAPFSVARSVAIVVQICSALEAAHGAGIIHRDLKPSNVMVETSTGIDHVRVLDFGMAKLLQGEAPGNTSLTEQNMVFGTPEYMSPEQAKGEELDAGCDIYAAGIILYELLTGGVPFVGSNSIATMTAHLVEPIVPPSKRMEGRALPPAVEAVVLAALEKDRRDRYASAAQMGSALRHAMAEPDDVMSMRPPEARSGSERAASAKYLAALHRDAPAPNSARVASAGFYELSTSGWIVIALVAAAAGVAIGIFISLRM